MSEYRIVSSPHPKALSERVAAAMADGWVPLGGVAFGYVPHSGGTHREDHPVWCQAMVREREPEPHDD